MEDNSAEKLGLSEKEQIKDQPVHKRDTTTQQPKPNPAESVSRGGKKFTIR